MSSFTQFFSGGKPNRVTSFTSGSGTYTPIDVNSWHRITIVNGGGGGMVANGGAGTGGARDPGDGTTSGAGAGGTGGGGGGGGCWVLWTRLQGAVTYLVGAGGTASAVLGNPAAPGGVSFLNGVAMHTAAQHLGSAGGAGPYAGAAGRSLVSPYGDGGVGGATNGAAGTNGTGGIIIFEEFGA